MKTIAILALVGIAAVAFLSLSSGPSSTLETQFRDFLETYRVGYGSNDEYNYRLSVFADNLKIIERLNKKNPRARFEINMFADKTPAELARMRGLTVSPKTKVTHIAPRGNKNVDWTHLWSKVKDQGQCGSCWAFSATAAYEARFHIAQGSEAVKTFFSEQQVVDCDTQSQGCNGGWMDYAFEYLHGHPFCSEDDYPYYAVDMTCDDTKCTGSQTMRGYHDIPAGNEDALLDALVNGPVSVAVDASDWSFYAGGIVDSCGSSLNHGVTLVKADADENSVTIRNSWSSGWGENGHIRLAVGQDMCGYADVASFPEF